jgi:hypothetical protein
MVWAADNRHLYHSLEDNLTYHPKIQDAIKKRAELVEDKRGGDSIFTIYATVDLGVEYFKPIHSGHFFYTPYKVGLHATEAKRDEILKSTNKEEILAWLNDYYDYNTYEVSIPALRDESLAPKGKVAMIISTLFDYDIAKHIQSLGWYDEFKAYSEERVINLLNKTIYPGFKDKITNQFSSTPLTLERWTGNTDGAITGWAFTNSVMPAEYRMPKIAKSADTPIPSVYQAGQWTYSPAGLPISILTGKLAADKAKKEL